MNEPHDLIETILLTEKATRLTESQSTYVFRVRPRATKPQIKEAVERVFNVKVSKIRTANVAGKPKRFMRSEGRRSSYKKAYVTLAEGQTINVVEGL